MSELLDLYTMGNLPGYSTSSNQVMFASLLCSLFSCHGLFPQTYPAAELKYLIPVLLLVLTDCKSANINGCKISKMRKRKHLCLETSPDISN